jgi:hypothetical protein
MVLIVGCGSASKDAGMAQPASGVASASPSPIPSPSLSISPSPSAAPTAKATTAGYISVRFTGLPSGTFPTHLHSICSGSQSFHITVAPSLVVRAGTGTIQVPAGYFGRGLCLIVYSSSSLSRVLTARRI